MQTFLPYPDLVESAHCLDTKRLGSQIMEVNTILGALHETNANGGYENHPVTRMWSGCELRLAMFGFACHDEWEARGFKRRKDYPPLEQHFEWAADGDTELPDWFGRPEVHESYKRLLIWKKPLHYQPMWPQLDGLDPQHFVYPT